jgi:transcriptional regulator with XRE-family HTH domain
MNTGRAIRTIRVARGLTQEALADRSGFSSTYISKIEKGNRHPNPVTMRAVSSALGVPPYLFQILAGDKRDVRRLSAQQARRLVRDLLDLLLARRG